MRQIILASTSPRRKELLKQLIGGNFIIIPSDYEEDHKTGLKPEALAEYLSKKKAESVAEKISSKYSDAIIIAADTLGELDKEILGKPHTEENARKMLKKMSGRTIKVITGITVIDLSTKKSITESETTKVKIKNLTGKEIESYVATKEPLDKGAAFAIQEKGAFLVEKINGDYFNVVGLPLYRLSNVFTKFKFDIFITDT